MATDVLLPKLGFSMTEGFIVEWLIPEGAMVEKGAPLFVIESDKSTTEVEAPASGTLRILKSINEPIPVGTVIAEIG
jgi:pyruvate/2-oxoglutarate dehydrogenase complex dihydrolipoamide acyltransferase (E2) component